MNNSTVLWYNLIVRVGQAAFQGCLYFWNVSLCAFTCEFRVFGRQSYPEQLTYSALNSLSVNTYSDTGLKSCSVPVPNTEPVPVPAPHRMPVPCRTPVLTPRHMLVLETCRTTVAVQEPEATPITEPEPEAMPVAQPEPEVTPIAQPGAQDGACPALFVFTLRIVTAFHCCDLNTQPSRMHCQALTTVMLTPAAAEHYTSHNPLHGPCNFLIITGVFNHTSTVR